MREVDPAFRQGVGVQAGLEIWRIEDSRPKALQKAEHGKFCSNQSYIVLQTCSLPTGAFQHNIHCWHGSCTNQSDAATAATKAVELSTSLGGYVVQTREIAGYESNRFLSYFKPCFIPFLQNANLTNNNPYQNRMFLCKGRHVTRIKEVPFSRSSLNHDGVFVADTRHRVYQFNGANTDTYERTQALDVVQYLVDNFHTEKCSIGIIEDGKLVADADSGEFWGLFGGYAPLMKKIENDIHKIEMTGKKLLHEIREGQIEKTQGSPLTKHMLEGSKTYLLECDTEVFIWMGHKSSLEDRKAAVLLAEEVSRKKGNSHQIKVFSINQDNEPVDFRLNFDLWPPNKHKPFSENGRQRVAVLLKQRGLNVQGLVKSALATENLHLKSSTGNLQVWGVKDGSKECLQPAKLVKFESSHCYVVLHSCLLDQRKEHFVYTWLSNQSSKETRATAASHAKEVASSLEEKAVEVRIFQDKEPDHFLSLFSQLVIMKDQVRDGSRSLFQVHQSGPSNWRAVQVNMVAASLNSSSCFFLQTGDSYFTWYGKFTSLEEQEATQSIICHLQPAAKLTMLKEGAELPTFWNMLGGRQVYPSHHELKESARSPRLFSCILHTDQLKVDEVFNFTQVDLFSDEIMILDCYTAIYVWVGETVSTLRKLRALEIGQMYLDITSPYEGNSLETAIYKIQDGSEPSLFKLLFSWDPSKIKQSRNPFQTKLLAIKGETTKQREVGEPTKPQEVLRSNKPSTIPNGKGVYLVPDKTKIPQKVTFKPEHPLNKFRQPKSKVGHGSTPERSAAVSMMSKMFEPQKGGEAPPNTPIVKLPTLSLKPKRPLRETPPPTPSTRTTPRSAISPVIASLSSVYESYNDRFAFAWPGMKLRHDERALSRDVDMFEFNTVEIDEEEVHQDEVFITVQADDERDRKAGQQPQRQEEQQRCHPYDRLKVSSGNPVSNIDSSKRECYLSNEEFQQVFLMDKDTFYKLPKWKQDKYKMLLDLF